MLTWEDTYQIARELREQNPEINLEEVSLDMIYQWTVDLPEFIDEHESANEGILLAIFQEWMEEDSNL